MLEAALEQMDGIIQGAKYELPQQFDNFTIQDSNHYSPSSVVGVKEALANLKKAIMSCPAGEGPPVLADRETTDFLYNWLKNNKSNYHSASQKWWKNDVNTAGIHDLSSVEERMQELEREKDTLQLQVTVLEDQIESQSRRIAEIERILQQKREECRRLEDTLQRERSHRGGGGAAAADLRHGELKSEVASLRLKCARLERDLTEYRNTTPRLARPVHLASLQHRSPTPVSSPDDASPGSRKGGSAGGGGPLLLSDDETAADTANEMDTSMVSLSGRSTRGLRKILGKIKRSNSGGFECERRAMSSASTAVAGGGGIGNDAVFKRGGTRATASGRLGWSSQNNGGVGANAAAAASVAAASSAVSFNRKRFSEWSVDMLCSWLETIGLGQYTSEVQRYIGTGADLARLGGADLDAKLGIRNPLHRKKLVLAMQAKIDPNRPDPAGDLDCAWVVRWLDDIGLPQYKETFLECRVDGRLLNLLTVDDLCYLRVSSLLHHCSIRRGIQILRQRGFHSEFLKRRAGDEDEEEGGQHEDEEEEKTAAGGSGCVDWSNHRVMEWLRQVDLAEYAPNLRGSGVHGALVVLEPKFNAELLASILSIPGSKTLLRRHLSIHFASLVGRTVMGEKRAAETDPGYVPLTPTAKHKSARHGQFTLKRKKSKSEFDAEDCLVCPLSPSTNTKFKA